MHTADSGPTGGQRAGRKRRGGECGDESEQERSRTGSGEGRREQLAPCPSAGAGTRRQAGEAELRRGRCGGSDVAGTPTQRPRKPSKRGRARYRTSRTEYNSRCSAAAWGVRGIFLYTNHATIILYLGSYFATLPFLCVVFFGALLYDRNPHMSTKWHNLNAEAI
jgi:hypothetical protein